MNLGVIWIIAIIVFAVLEAVTYQLISTWFAIGSVGGLVAYLLGFDFNVQMTVFLVLSIITLCCLRPLSVKKLKPKGLKTNTENIIGKEVLITETVDNTKECGKGNSDCGCSSQSVAVGVFQVFRLHCRAAADSSPGSTGLENP